MTQHKSVWAVADYDGHLRAERWATEQEAVDKGLCGKYLLSGAEVVEVAVDDA